MKAIELMKVNELMIGDLIRIVDDDSNQSFETRVDGVSAIGNIYCPLPEGEHAYPFAAECAEPIPLTVEILEKNGFKRSAVNNGDSWWDKKGLILVKMYDLRHDGTVFSVRGCYSRIGSIKSVHEFQHALRLCRSEQEIVL